MVARAAHAVFVECNAGARVGHGAFLTIFHSFSPLQETARKKAAHRKRPLLYPILRPRTRRSGAFAQKRRSAGRGESAGRFRLFPNAWRAEARAAWNTPCNEKIPPSAARARRGHGGRELHTVNGRHPAGRAPFLHWGISPQSARDPPPWRAPPLWKCAPFFDITVNA